MPRKKKTEPIKEEVHSESKEPLFCGLRKCPHLECLIHYKNAPFGVLIRLRKFAPDKDWNCKDIVKE